MTSVVRGRSRVLPPFRQQLIETAGIDDRAGQNVGSDLGALFDDDDGDLAALGGRILLQTDRGGQTRRTGAHDDDVEFHRFTVGQIHRGFSWHATKLPTARFVSI